MQVIQNVAVNGEQVVFIVEDYQLLHEAFLQAINSLLSSGDLPGLFTPQEFDSFLVALRDQASQEAFQGDLHSYFAKSRFSSSCFTFPECLVCILKVCKVKVACILKVRIVKFMKVCIV